MRGYHRRRSGAAASDLVMTHDEPPNRRFRRAFHNWNGFEPAWLPNPTTDLRELVAFAKFPFAALSPRSTPLRYRFWQRGRPHFVEATPVDANIGLATVADLDVMIVVASYLTWHHNIDGAPYVGTLALRPAALLHALGKSTGGEQHRNLHAALTRLTNTEIATSLGGCGDTTFRLLQRVHPPNHKGELTLEIDHWLWTEVRAERIVKIDPVALTLRGLERRLYSWARVHLGAVRNEWRVSVPRAHAKIASLDALRKFRSRLALVALRNRLPHFLVALERNGQDTDLLLTRRAALTAADNTLVLPAFDIDTQDTTPIETVFLSHTFADDD